MFTKAEIEKLSIEHREVLAKFEISVARQREQLLKAAQGYRGSFLLQVGIAMLVGIPLGAILMIFVWPHLDSGEQSSALFVLCGLAIYNSLISTRTAHINGRLDALLKLLDFDRQNQNINDSSKGKTD